MSSLGQLVASVLAADPPAYPPPMEPPAGVIPGGWEYVWAAYILTWVVVTAYGLSLWLRYSSRVKEAGAAGGQP